MISKLSKILFNNFLLEKTDTQEDIDVYQFALFVLISTIIYFIAALLIGILFSCVIEMLLFFLVFQLLRIFAGGYHSNSENRCELLSALSIFIVGLIIKLSKGITPLHWISTFSSIVSVFVITLLSPIEAKVKPLSKIERKKYRRNSLIIVFIVIIIIIYTVFINLSIIYIPCCLSLLLESILLVAGAIKEHLVNGN